MTDHDTESFLYAFFSKRIWVPCCAKLYQWFDSIERDLSKCRVSSNKHALKMRPSNLMLLHKPTKPNKATKTLVRRVAREAAAKNQ